MMSEAADGGMIQDKRRAPFCYQTLEELELIRDAFDGQRRSTALAIYLALTEAANRHGGDHARRNGFKAFRVEIAELAGVSVDTLDRYVSQFENLGLVRVERESIGKLNLPNTWVLTSPSAPPGRTGAATPSRTDAATLAAPVRHHARDPLPEHKKDLVKNPPVGPPNNRPTSVDRKTVTDAEYEMAADILLIFNRAADTKFSSKDFIAKIVMRVREHPEVDLRTHARVVARSLADPWWKGAASPSVIYGNGALFERALADVDKPPPGRSMSSDELDGYGTLWGPGTPYRTPEDAHAGIIEHDLERAVEDVHG